MNRALDAFKRTLGAIVADRSVRMTMIVAIIIYSFYYPAAYQHQVASHLPLVIVDEDRSATSRELLRRVQALRATEVVAQLETMHRAKSWLEEGHAQGILMIPDGLERDILRGDGGQLVLLGNGGYLAHANAVMAGVASAVTSFGQDSAQQQAVFMGAPQSPPIVLQQYPMYNVTQGYGSALLPGVTQLILHQTMTMGIAGLMGARRKKVQGRRLRIAPSSLLGMLAAFMLVGLFGLLYYAGFTFWFHDYPRGGNLPGLLLVGPLFLLATALFGLFIGSFMDRRERAIQYVICTSIPLVFLSNLVWPISSFPPFLMAISKLFPSTAGINGMIGLSQLGASLGEVHREIGNLLALVLLYGALTLWRYRPVPGGVNGVPVS